MRNISTQFDLDEEEYLKLKMFCAKKNKSIRELTKELALNFINNSSINLNLMNDSNEINTTQ